VNTLVTQLKALFAALLLGLSLAPHATPAASVRPMRPLRWAESSATAGPTATAEPTVAAEPTATAEPTVAAEPTSTVFAVIGDYGTGNQHEADVAHLVASWNPSFIVTTGDNYYPCAGGAGSDCYGRSVGRFFGPWVSGATGLPPALDGTRPSNAFFPALGNHDYITGQPSPQAYLDYFDLPGPGFSSSSGNERYYDFTEGPIHFFILDSNPREPSGTSARSTQARWLRHALASSKSSWNVVVAHQPPFSSDNMRGSIDYMRWPFAKWGADAVLSGHAHVYERVMHGGIPYLVNGLGGGTRYAFSTAIPGSVVRYCANWGAQRVTETGSKLRFEFFAVDGQLIDRYDITR
jgi:tartrate-resistant acid phosphatase type 5